MWEMGQSAFFSSLCNNANVSVFLLRIWSRHVCHLLVAFLLKILKSLTLPVLFWKIPPASVKSHTRIIDFSQIQLSLVWNSPLGAHSSITKVMAVSLKEYLIQLALEGEVCELQCNYPDWTAAKGWWLTSQMVGKQPRMRSLVTTSDSSLCFGLICKETLCASLKPQKLLCTLWIELRVTVAYPDAQVLYPLRKTFILKQIECSSFSFPLFSRLPVCLLCRMLLLVCIPASLC